MRTAAFIAALAVAVPTTQAVERARFLMGTVCEVAVNGEHAEAEIEAAFAEAKRVEQLLSTWVADSELSRVNRGAEPGDELRSLLALTAEWTVRTNGAFDPRWREGSGVPVTSGQGRDRQRESGELRVASCESCDRQSEQPSQPATRNPQPLIRKSPPQYDPGAWGKGYALDRMLALTTGEAVLDFGGQLIVRGEHEVAIANPDQRDRPVLALVLKNASLATSSGSEKPGHIVDPRTAEPVHTGGSASAIADDAMTADILSTALFVMGEDDGLRWADANGVAAIYITASRHIRLSAKARERVRGLSLLDRNYSLKD